MFIVDCGIFPFDVLVCLNVTKEALLKEIKNNATKQDLKWIKKHSVKKGLYVLFQNNSSLIYMPTFKKNAVDFSILQHEITHCVVAVLGETNIKLSAKTEEVFAYLTQHLTEKIYEKLEVTFS